ncbi:hypothetical protein M0805_001984 [Coniferiporia weirii]|nr:hypothetical protein M0805_001984 [Coniferiporia weirii]
MSSANTGSKRPRSQSPHRASSSHRPGSQNDSDEPSCLVPHYNRYYRVTALQTKLHAETRRYIVGPMPISAFLDAFFPKSGGLPEPAAPPSTFFRHIYNDAIHTVKKASGKQMRVSEKEMYQPFIECMSELKLASLEFVNSSTHGDEDWVIEGLKPDVSVYRKGPSISGTRFSEMEFFVEFKPHRDDDPFEDTSNNSSGSGSFFVKSEVSAQQIIGQMVSYAVAHLGSSFRTHTFSVLVLGDIARIIRWDRAGAIVTEPIEYTKDSTSFAEFFRRFDQLTPEQRGHDTTVSTPTSEELAKARLGFKLQNKDAENNEDLQSCCNTILDQTLHKFAVQKDDGSEPSYFVGPMPERKTLSLVGRASRGSPVCDLKTGRICYLKDTWRIDASHLLREGKIYENLHIHNVPHIASLVSEDDVRNVEKAEALCARAPSLQDITNIQTDAKALSDDNVLTMQPYNKPLRCDSTAIPPNDSSIGASSAQNTDPPSSTAAGMCRLVSDSQVNRKCRDLPTDAKLDVIADTSAPSVNTDARPTRSDMQVQGIEMAQSTVTQLYANRSWVFRTQGGRRRLQGYIHYRLVLGTVGRDLTSFRSTKEMLTAVTDAMEAHGKAYEDAGVLHCDVSPENILITEDGRGILIDWDLSEGTHEQREARHGRTGTWQFISAAFLLDKRGKQHTYADDLESFLHVITYICVRYSPSTYTGDMLRNYLKIFNEEHVVNEPDGSSHSTGGNYKGWALLARIYIPNDLTFHGRPKLHDCLRRFSSMFYSFYVNSEPTLDDPLEIAVSGGTTSEADLRWIAEKEKRKAKKIDLMNKWSEGGTIAARIFKETFDDKAAWPSDDRSKLMSTVTLFYDASVEDSDSRLPEQVTSYASICTSGSGATSTSSAVDEPVGSGGPPSMHALDGGDENPVDGGDREPPLKRIRTQVEQ